MDRSKLAAQLESGRSIESIARELGRDPSTVAYWVNKHGLVSVFAAKHAPRGGLARAAGAAGRGGSHGSAHRRGTRPRRHDGALLAEETRPVDDENRDATGGRATGVDHASLSHARVHRTRPDGRRKAVPMQAMSRGRGLSAPATGEARAGSGGGWRLPPVRIRPLRRRPPVPSPRAGREGLLDCRSGGRTVARAGARGGREVRSPLRELPRGGRGRSRYYAEAGSRCRIGVGSGSFPIHRSGVIQSAECSAVNRVVVGSSPTPRALRAVRMGRSRSFWDRFGRFARRGTGSEQTQSVRSTIRYSPRTQPS
jgi:helix-turn-helix protein